MSNHPGSFLSDGYPTRRKPQSPMPCFSCQPPPIPVWPEPEQAYVAADSRVKRSRRQDRRSTFARPTGHGCLRAGRPISCQLRSFSLEPPYISTSKAARCLTTLDRTRQPTCYRDERPESPYPNLRPPDARGSPGGPRYSLQLAIAGILVRNLPYSQLIPKPAAPGPIPGKSASQSP